MMTQYAKKGQHVEYRVRWDREALRRGIVGRVTHTVIWIDSGCYLHSDITFIREVVA